nr:uncharacterized protein LOC109147873 [Ipomoea trifida]
MELSNVVAAPDSTVIAVVVSYSAVVTRTIAKKVGWCRPIGGSIKINWTANADEKGCAYFARNSRGEFCAAGVYSLADGGNLNNLIVSMLHGCLDWCRGGKLMSVIFEADDWRGLEDAEWRRAGGGMFIRVNKCSERVNAVASCLLRCCPGQRCFRRKEDLPRGLGRILALEGIGLFEQDGAEERMVSYIVGSKEAKC